MRATICIVTAPVSTDGSVASASGPPAFRLSALPRIAPLLDCDVIDNTDTALWKISPGRREFGNGRSRSETRPGAICESAKVLSTASRIANTA